MVPHVNAVCQSSFFHLRNIGFIRKYLTYDAAKIIIHAFVVFKLDYCNSLLYGLPPYLIRKLQHVQNSAARLVNQCPRFCHTTPVLCELMNRDVFICYLIFYLLCTFIYFVVSV